ncbi:putative bifunctional diguanylate cyclase/phosphodiesterase [Enterovirga sp. GCM10030262]|uniref:putative bifunctional diguanylate cyclase/phosphodiesterase n=1 Tax=Enterovirga sp. GCM10030262 TaxID=3273391 RepID=UPI0036096A21
MGDLGHKRGKAARAADKGRDGGGHPVPGDRLGLRAEAERWRRTLDTVPQMIWAMRVDGGEDYYNRHWIEFVGQMPDGPDGVARIDLVHPDDREQAGAIWRKCRATGEPYEAEYRLRHKSGEYRWILSRARVERDEAGEMVRWCGACTDIHDHVLAQQALRASESLNRGIIEANPDCVALLDLDGTILFANQATLRAREAEDSAALVGRRWEDGFDATGGRRGLAARALAAAQKGRLGRAVLRRPGKRTKWWDAVVAPVLDPSGRPIKLVSVSRDITRQKAAETKVRWTALHDSLTRLPNRLQLQQKLDEAIAGARASAGTFALLLLDVDDFKQVNDTLGHDSGDALLRDFAARLAAAARPGDLVARLGGDEFAVLIGDRPSEGIEEAVSATVDRLRAPCGRGDRVMDCQASVGASLYPIHGESRAELMKNADIALYAAKAAGRGKLRLFTPEMRHEMQKRASMLTLARNALRHERIIPYYQPKVELRTGRVAGFEALLRWDHPGRGMQAPDTIAAAFEDLTLAAAISDRMIDGIVADMRRWIDQGVDFGHVAINAAAAEFRRGDFAEQLLERLRHASVATGHVQIEITETVFLGRGAEHVERALKMLSAEGIRIALDDFGTGHASLSHLKQFPVDIIKIDQSFVRDLEQDPEDAAIINAVINLGHNLGIRTVAEGVETVTQQEFLMALGCDYGQGFLYARPAPASDVPALLSLPRPTRALVA